MGTNAERIRELEERMSATTGSSNKAISKRESILDELNTLRAEDADESGSIQQLSKRKVFSRQRHSAEKRDQIHASHLGTLSTNFGSDGVHIDLDD